MASLNHGELGASQRAIGNDRYRSARLSRLAGVAGLACAAVVALSGCEWDSFIDPSVVGRWERTPTVVPVLERLTAIEDESADYIEITDVTPEDLIPDVAAYRIGPGDGLIVDLYDDMDNRGVPSRYERQVDIRGYIDLPQLGQLYVRNLNPEQAQAVIAQGLAKYVHDPLVSVVVAQQRQQTFTLIGLMDQPGPYFISKPDYRLLDAIPVGGRFPLSVQEIFVIRQIPLSDVVKGVSTPAPIAPAGEAASPIPSIDTKAEPPKTPPTEPAKPSKDDEKLIDLIDELSAPKEPSAGTAPTESPKPIDPPAQDPPKPDAPKQPSYAMVGSAHSAVARPNRQPPAETTPPPIDLLDSKSPTPEVKSETALGQAQNGDGTWVFLNGEWVKVRRAPDAAPGGTQETKLTADQLITQRVIRVPFQALMSGLAQYNIVVRPGDIIHIPTPRQGLVYVAGQVQRPGPYSLPDIGKLTLIRAIDAAGGLGGIAIPERVDLTRVVGRDRQATIRLNYRAIVEGTQPDVYMRADDRINVGTNFWAYPLAVLRNGLRMSYGFGFVVDRNFDIEIFGSQPVRFR